MTYTLEEMESMKKYEEKLAKNREYQRKWMAKKRQEDPEFYAKQKAYNAQKKKEKYAKDEEFRKKELEYNKAYIAKKKQETENFKELKKGMDKEKQEDNKMYLDELEQIRKRDYKSHDEILTFSLDWKGCDHMEGYIERCQLCKKLMVSPVNHHSPSCICDNPVYPLQ